jgi:hypothetical protein
MIHIDKTTMSGCSYNHVYDWPRRSIHLPTPPPSPPQKKREEEEKKKQASKQASSFCIGYDIKNQNCQPSEMSCGNRFQTSSTFRWHNSDKNNSNCYFMQLMLPRVAILDADSVNVINNCGWEHWTLHKKLFFVDHSSTLISWTLLLLTYS